MDTSPRPREPSREATNREAEELAAASASIETGWFATEAEVARWIDSIGTAEELPPPMSGRARQR